MSSSEWPPNLVCDRHTALPSISNIIKVQLLFSYSCPQRPVASTINEVIDQSRYPVCGGTVVVLGHCLLCILLIGRCYDVVKPSLKGNA